MGADISEIVNITITRETAAVTRAGFGTLLVVGAHTENADRIRFYTDLDGLTDDGFSSSDEIYKAVEAAFAQSPRPERVAVGRIDAGDYDIVESMEAIQEASNDWYGVVLCDRTLAVVQALAGWIETQVKLFITATSAPGVIDPGSTTDIAYLLEAANYDRTAVIYSADEDNYPDAAWFGRMLPTDPGAATWKFKSLNGVTPDDDLTSTEMLAAQNKHANLYRTIGGVPITSEGYAAGGEFIDVMHGADWLQARMTERVYALLASSPKVPFTDPGITAIEGEVRAQLGAAVDIGFLAADPAPTVTSPKASAVSAGDKAARDLQGVKFYGTLAGAIHKVGIQGFVQV